MRALYIGMIIALLAMAAWPATLRAADSLDKERQAQAQRFSPGAIDNRGNYYTRSGPGVVDPKDGVYYAPAGKNGYVNTKTGEFTPLRNR